MFSECTCKDIASQEVMDIILLEDDIFEYHAEEMSERATDTTTTSLDKDSTYEICKTLYKPLQINISAELRIGLDYQYVKVTCLNDVQNQFL